MSEAWGRISFTKARGAFTVKSSRALAAVRDSSQKMKKREGKKKSTRGF